MEYVSTTSTTSVVSAFVPCCTAAEQVLPDESIRNKSYAVAESLAQRLTADEALAHDSWLVRRIFVASVCPKMYRGMFENDPDAEVRAISAAGTTDPAQLVRAMSDPSWRVRAAAAGNDLFGPRAAARLQAEANDVASFGSPSALLTLALACAAEVKIRNKDARRAGRDALRLLFEPLPVRMICSLSQAGLVLAAHNQHALADSACRYSLIAHAGGTLDSEVATLVLAHPRSRAARDAETMRQYGSDGMVELFGHGSIAAVA
jgi:hypothetical protein